MHRMFVLCLALLISLSGVTAVIPALACTSSGVPAVVTDRSDYFAGDNVAIKASGLACAAAYTITVTAPNGVTQQFSVVADGDGAAYASLPFGGDPGDHEIEVSDATGAVVARAHFHGSHFRYGHLTWRPVGTRQAEFTLINAFRRSGYGSPVVGSVFTETVGGTSLCFGDGNCTGTLRYETLAFDAAQDWVIGRALPPSGASVPLPGTGVTVAATEPNDTIAQANPVNVGDNYAADISPSGDRDTAVFTLTAPAKVMIRARHTGTMNDSYLYLLNSAGSVIAANDDTFGLEAYIEQNLAAGTYYVQAAGFSSNTGTYTVELRQAGAAPTTFTHTYSGAGPFTAQISSCCRIGSLQNGSNGSYIVSTLVRFDQANSSPVSALPPIVNAPVNTAGFSFLVPAVDADGDTLSFRLATSGESGAPSMPGLSVNGTTGVVSWSTVGRSVGQLWTQQIIIEERRAGVLIGRVGVDFIIRIVGAIGNAPTCAFTPSQTTYNIQAGSALSFTVTGSDVDASDTLQLNTAGLPAGATMSPGLPRTGASPLSSTFSWTPPSSQNNASFIVAFTVSDANGQAAQCSVTINVTAQPTNRPPTANAGGPYTVAEGGSLALSGSGSDPDAGQTLTYAWDLDNDGTFEAAGLPATFSAATIDGPATRTVVLKVCDSATPSACDTDAVDVAITNVAPTATASNDGPSYWGVAIGFTGTATDPSAADTSAGFTGAWAFGDSATAAGMTASHSYATPGSYTASFTAGDKDGGTSAPATTVVTVNQRPTALACADASAVFGFATTLTSELRDGVSNTVLAGGTITWTVNGVSLTGSATPVGLMPGTHSVGATFAGNTLYTGSTATCTLTVTNSVGKITSGLVKFEGRGRGGFNVQNDATTLGPKGELQFQNTAIDLHVHTMTAIGISADKTKGWFAGTGTAGQKVVVYVEDNGEPGSTDVVKVWIDGISQNGDGGLSGGNVQIH